MENNLPQTPNSTGTYPQQANEQQPMTQQKSLLPMIFGGLAVLIVGLAGGYYLGMNKAKNVTPQTVVSQPTATPALSESTTHESENPQVNTNIYKNTEYGISFTLEENESVVPCENQNEYNDNVALSVRENMPVGFDPANYCATDGMAGQIFLSKRASEEQSIEKYLEMLKGEGYEYKVTTTPITISGVTGLRITGNRDDAVPTPLPPTVDEAVFERNGNFYVIPAEYLERELSFF